MDLIQQFVRRYRRWCLCLVCVVPVVVLSVPDLAWARAGGGGGFGGGGGGGGGGSGGSGGGGDGGQLFYLLYWLCVHHPMVGYPLVIGLILLFFYGGNNAQARHVTRTIQKGVQRQQARVREEMLAAIKSHDASFLLPAFLERTKEAFTKLQYAWSEQDLSGVRAFVSDGIYERFSLQIGMQQQENFRNVMQKVKVLELNDSAIYSNQNFDTIHVRIRASAQDFDQDLKTGKRLTSANTEEFVEYWSFHRRPGAKSIQGDGTIEGRCPRCGSPLKIIDKAVCPSCQAQVNSGEFDWVLAEITQEQEWHVPGNDTLIPGIPELQQRDPAFSIQHIEDRVSVMFWRLRAAEFYDDINYADPVITPNYRIGFQKELQDPKFWKEPAVGKVEIIDAMPESADGMSRVRVKVRWSGILMEESKAGSSRLLRDKTIYTHMFVLIRKQGVESVAQAAFLSAGCGSCGAPVDVNEVGACVYCGAMITSGQYDWVLDDIQPFNANMAYQAIRPVENLAGEWSGSAFDGHRDAELSLAVLARVMLVDGHLERFHR